MLYRKLRNARKFSLYDTNTKIKPLIHFKYFYILLKWNKIENRIKRKIIYGLIQYVLFSKINLSFLEA